MNSENSNSVLENSETEVLPNDVKALFSIPEDYPGWVEVRCSCNKLLFRMMAAPTIDGVKKVVKLGLDIKCRRCKLVNYRIIVI